MKMNVRGEVNGRGEAWVHLIYDGGQSALLTVQETVQLIDMLKAGINQAAIALSTHGDPAYCLLPIADGFLSPATGEPVSMGVALAEGRACAVADSFRPHEEDCGCD